MMLVGQGVLVLVLAAFALLLGVVSLAAPRRAGAVGLVALSARRRSFRVGSPPNVGRDRLPRRSSRRADRTLSRSRFGGVHGRRRRGRAAPVRRVDARRRQTNRLAIRPRKEAFAMSLEPLTLETLHKAENGLIAKAFDGELSRVLDDLNDRPHLAKPRKLVLE